jgi:hypothetical protein
VARRQRSQEDQHQAPGEQHTQANLI